MDLDTRSFYDAVQALEGHTIISSLKGQTIDALLTSIENEVHSFLDSIRNDIKQRQSSDQIYNPLFLLKLWDLARNEYANYFENRNKNECDLNYNPKV
jgi:phospholipase/lecithinase/hemolysin